MPSSDSDDTRAPFRRKEVERAAQFLAHPLIQLIDRGLVWIAIIVGGLLLAGGKTYFHGLVKEAPAFSEIHTTQSQIQDSLKTLVNVQRDAATAQQGLASDVRLVIQRVDQQDKRIDRIERIVDKP